MTGADDWYQRPVSSDLISSELIKPVFNKFKVKNSKSEYFLRDSSVQEHQIFKRDQASITTRYIGLQFIE